jgi:CheY-like chemotaxis protein
VKILHLEDSVHDAELFAEVLRGEWPEVEIRRVATAKDFTRSVMKGGFDLILSDNTLPDIDGLRALELARRWCPQAPFVFLSGTIGEERAVEALRRGAMDYVIKDRPGRLPNAIRQVLARREEQARRLREDRMESIGMMAGGVVHDLNNILGPILGAAQVLKAQGQHSDSDNRMLTMIETSARHGAELIKQLLAFARGSEGSPGALRVDQQMAHLELMLKPTLGQAISLRLSVPETPWPILADATQFNQVILNLCVNARDAMPDGGMIEISIQNVVLDAKSPPRSGGAAGALSAGLGRRHRHGDRAGRRPEDLRAVLHDEARGQGHRIGPVDGPRDRSQPRRVLAGRDRSREGVDLPPVLSDDAPRFRARLGLTSVPGRHRPLVGPLRWTGDGGIWCKLKGSSPVASSTGFP